MSTQTFKYYHILNLIRHIGPVSRTQLAAMTEYRAGTVGDIAKQMIEAGVIFENTDGSSGRSRLLQINCENLLAVGIAISEKRTSLTLEQSDGIVLKKIQLLHADLKTTGEIISAIVSSTVSLVHLAAGHKIIGIGVACPPYDPSFHQSDSLDDDILHFNDWITENLREPLRKETGIPVHFLDFIGLGAIEKFYFGEAKGTRNFICVELSNGLGASAFCNGKLFTGAGGGGCQIGHTVIDHSKRHDTICRCGKIGCVESYCAWPAIKKRILDALHAGTYSSIGSVLRKNADILAKDVGEAAERGDALCRSCIKDSATDIGIAIANAVNLFEPEKVILYGFMLELGDYFIKTLCESIRENTVPISTMKYEIVISSLHDDLTPEGAAAQIFSSYMRIDQYDWVYEDSRYAL